MKRWDGIDEFIAVVETGSFSKAGASLGVGVSQISKRISQLESRLGTRLLNRSTRTMRLSNHGKAYYDACKKIVEEMNRVEDLIQENEGQVSGNLKLCCVGGSRSSFQTNILSGFSKRYPTITLETEFLDELPNLIEKGIDISLVTGEVSNPAYFSMRIAWTDYRFCASQAFIDEHGMPQHPEELKDYMCIRDSNDSWTVCHQDGELVNVEVSGNWKSPNLQACINACIDGLGIFMIPAFSARGIFADQRLVPLLTEWRLRKPLHLVLPQQGYLSNNAQLFRDYLVDGTLQTADGAVSGVIPAITEEQLSLISKM